MIICRRLISRRQVKVILSFTHTQLPLCLLPFKCWCVLGLSVGFFHCCHSLLVQILVITSAYPPPLGQASDLWTAKVEKTQNSGLFQSGLCQSQPVLICKDSVKMQTKTGWEWQKPLWNSPEFSDNSTLAVQRTDICATFQSGRTTYINLTSSSFDLCFCFPSLRLVAIPKRGFWNVLNQVSCWSYRARRSR